MDLERFSREELREFCRDHELYAAGSRADLAARINEFALTQIQPGKRAEVYYPAQNTSRSGIILRVLKQGIVEVMFDDNNKCGRHDIMACAFEVEEGESSEWETDDEEEGDLDGWETDDGQDMEDDPDLPATMGLQPGTLIQVQRLEEPSFMWPATLGKRIKGRQTDEDGRLLYRLTYDALPDYGYKKEKKTKVSFIDQDTLNDKGDELLWQLYGKEDGSQAEEEEEEEEEYGVGGITAGMAGLGSGTLGAGLGSGTQGAGPSSSTQGAGGGKRALVVACSYPGSSSPLPGTLNDARDIIELLEGHFGVPQGNIKVLVDSEKDPLRHPTRLQIVHGFQWLMEGVTKHGVTSLFFYFAGHGDTRKDPTGRERRGNQTILPCDYSTAGVITDSEIFKYLVEPLPMCAKLHALIDSCHSGTVMNLPWNAVMEGGSFTRWHEEYPGEAHEHSSGGGNVIQFSAAKHNQTAAEGFMQGGRRGAATYAFTHAIKRNKAEWGSDIPYGVLLRAMAYELKYKFKDQTPTMSASWQFDPKRADMKLHI